MDNNINDYSCFTGINKRIFKRQHGKCILLYWAKI